MTARKSSLAFRVVTDSIVAPSMAKAEEHGIAIVPLHIHFGTEVMEDVYGLTAEEFYLHLAEAKELPRTSAPSIGRFARTFRSILAAGDECLCLTVGKNLSNTHNVALQARRTFDEKERRRIAIVDTTAAGVAGALLAIEAANLARAGWTMEETRRRTHMLKEHTRFIGMIDTLAYIERSGRVGKIAAVSTHLFRVKPLFRLENAEVRPFGFARGRRQAVKKLVSTMKKDTRDAKRIFYGVTHADGPGVGLLLEGLEAMEAAVFVDTVPFTPAMGAHTGPGVLGVGYMSLPDEGLIRH